MKAVKILEILKEKNMSIYALAKKAYVPYSTLRELIMGIKDIKKCNILTFFKIAKALEISVDDIYKYWVIANDFHGIPKELYNYFWDADPEKLDIYKNKWQIVCRLLNKGGVKGVRFVNKTYDKNELSDVARGARDFNVISANYIRQKCNLKKQDMKFYKTYSNSKKVWNY